VSDDAALGRWVADRMEIRDLVTRYAVAVDRKDWAAVRACFTDDATCDYAWFQGDVTTVLELIERGLSRFESTMHLVGNHLAEVDGDAASAETYTLCHHRFRAPEGAIDRIAALRYLDGLVRTPQGWRIRRRDVAVDWERADPVEAT
jgi:ketosteroid isomerase-like protein